MLKLHVLQYLLLYEKISVTVVENTYLISGHPLVEYILVIIWDYSAVAGFNSSTALSTGTWFQAASSKTCFLLHPLSSLHVSLPWLKCLCRLKMSPLDTFLVLFKCVIILSVFVGVLLHSEQNLITACLSVLSRDVIMLRFENSQPRSNFVYLNSNCLSHSITFHDIWQ